ncbi:MAG TPA: PRC-barrel domain-containing protein [Allocoleopsis sp.]
MVMSWAELYGGETRYSKPSYRKSLIGFGVFSDLVAGVLSDTTHERIGTVREILTDATGRVQYFVVELGCFPYYSRLVLLPSDRAYIHLDSDRVYAAGISKEQAERLPPFDSSLDRRNLIRN